VSSSYHNISVNREYLLASSYAIDLQNRSFKYGDGFFETIHANGLKAQFLADHFQRIQKAAQILYIDLPAYFSLAFFEQQISGLLSRNKLFQAARVKATFVRAGGGIYKPETNQTELLIEASYLGKGPYALNEQGVVLGVFDAMAKPIMPYLQIKSSNAQFYVLASLFASQHGFDDALLLSADGYLVEATSSNVFVVQGKQLFTPSLELGCVQGVMRKQILKLASELGYQVNANAFLKPADLLAMDEVFLTNAIQGISYVSGFENRRYFKKGSQKLMQSLNQLAFT
jgi:branched-chain amino acid aminotransferase